MKTSSTYETEFRTNPTLSVGMGLRHKHHPYVLEKKPPTPWFEVHSENYFHPGGKILHFLLETRKHYPISLHGVGLSLGSAEGVLTYHLSLLKKLVDKVDPLFISDHLSWNQVGHTNFNELLPLPYTKEAIKCISLNIEKTQEYLGRQISIENPSSYFEYTVSDFSEPDFINEVSQQSGAGILLDINNIYVSSCNHGWDPKIYIDKIRGDKVTELHLAGHAVKRLSDGSIVHIDTHDTFICPEVWELYDYALSKIGPKPTLVEWDGKIPPYPVLEAEAARAQQILNRYLPSVTKKAAS